MGAEKSFETRLVKKLREIGVWVFKTHGGLMQRSGIPDLLCCVNGHFLAIEVKANGGKVSELQKHCIKELREAGASSYVVYPDQINDILCIVNAVQNINFGERVYEITRKQKTGERGHEQKETMDIR